MPNHADKYFMETRTLVTQVDELVTLLEITETPTQDLTVWTKLQEILGADASDSTSLFDQIVERIGHA